jgi:hypothetical protein
LAPGTPFAFLKGECLPLGLETLELQAMPDQIRNSPAPD